MVSVWDIQTCGTFSVFSPECPAGTFMTCGTFMIPLWDIHRGTFIAYYLGDPIDPDTCTFHYCGEHCKAHNPPKKICPNLGPQGCSRSLATTGICTHCFNSKRPDLQGKIEKRCTASVHAVRVHNPLATNQAGGKGGWCWYNVLDATVPFPSSAQTKVDVKERIDEEFVDRKKQEDLRERKQQLKDGQKVIMGGVGELAAIGREAKKEGDEPGQALARAEKASALFNTAQAMTQEVKNIEVQIKTVRSAAIAKRATPVAKK